MDSFGCEKDSLHTATTMATANRINESDDNFSAPREDDYENMDMEVFDEPCYDESKDMMISASCMKKVDEFMTEALEGSSVVTPPQPTSSVPTPPPSYKSIRPTTTIMPTATTVTIPFVPPTQQPPSVTMPLFVPPTQQPPPPPPPLATMPLPTPSATAATPGLTGRPPNMLYLSCDPNHLSPYQVLVRKHMEVFEALPIDVVSNAQGRNVPIVLGQVGIRCRHCSRLEPKQRSKGAVYYPTKLLRIYQAAQNLASIHLCESCPYVPPMVRAELLRLREDSSQNHTSRGGGKEHWAQGIQKAFGVYEDDHGLRYESRLQMM